MASTKKVNVAVIGCGVIAPSHIESYSKLPGVKVTALCDKVIKKAESLASKYSIPHVEKDYLKILSDPEIHAVSICTDHASHSKIAVDALNAGKHVLCEKALTSDRKKLAAMINAGKKHPELVFGGVFQHRFDKVHQYVRELVGSGVFGRMLNANVNVECLRTNDYYKADKWRGTWAEEGGSVLINQAIHFLDMLAWIMGGVESVSASYANLAHKGVIETEDTASASVIFKDGTIGTISATCASHIAWEPTLSFYGTKGSLEVRDGKLLRACFIDKKIENKITKDLLRIKEAMNISSAKSYYGSGHPAQIADFIKAVRGEKKIFIPATSAAHTADLVFSIYESHRTGKRVRLVF